MTSKAQITEKWKQKTKTHKRVWLADPFGSISMRSLLQYFYYIFLNVGKGVSIWQRWHFFVCSLNHWFVPHIHLGFNSFTSTQIHSLNTQSLIRSSVRPSVDRTSLVSVFNVCLSISIYFRKLLLKSLPPDTLFSQGLVRKGSFEIL